MMKRGIVIALLAMAVGAVVCLVVEPGVWRGLLERAGGGAGVCDPQVVATVYGRPLTRSQLARAVSERLWLAGKDDGALTPEDRAGIRQAALTDLIDHELLRVKAAKDDPQLAVDAAAVDAGVRRFGQRFESREAMLAALKSQGLGGERELRDLIAARLRQERYVESRIRPLVAVTAEEARQWYDAHRDQLGNPERVEVRHVFIATLERPQEEARAKLAAAMADLTGGTKDFATLAKELSEDPATSGTGGSLGWLSRARLPEDFAAAVFALPLRTPTLVHTRLGWHLVEVTGRQAAAPRTFDEAKPEIVSAIEAVKRQQAVSDFRETLRRFEASHIEVYPDRLDP